MKQLLKNVLYFFCIAAIITSCQDDIVPIEEESLAINNPIALELQSRAKEVRYKLNESINIVTTSYGNASASDNDITISFEEKYGKIMYNDIGVSDDESNRTMFPLVDENNKIVNWLVGFYKDSGEIQYYVSKVLEGKEDMILDGETPLTFNFDDKQIYYDNSSVSNDIENSNLNQHIISSSVTTCYDTYVNICWYFGDFDADCRYTFAGRSCTTTIAGFDPPEGDGWEDPFGGGGSGGSGGGLTPCPIGFDRDENNVCVALEFTENLTGKSKCIYDKIENQDAIKSVLDRFRDSNSISSLRIELASLGDAFAETLPPDASDLIVIQLNNDSGFWGVDFQPNLLVAQTIFHEVIHAEFFRQIVIAIGAGNYHGATPLQVLNALQNSDYSTLYDHYRRYRDWSHNFMANYYLDTIARATQEYVTGISVPNSQAPQELYLNLAWKGLRNDGEVQAWDELTEAQKTAIDNIIFNYTDANKNENCTQ